MQTPFILRKTKIVATLGPASSSDAVLGRMMDAGLDLVRLNFSHGKGSDHAEVAERVRALARERKRAVGVLADLQGPKIRIGKFAEGKVSLAPGDRFILDAACEMGDQTRVGLDYKELTGDVGPGDTLLLADGFITMTVNEVKGPEIFCTVVQGGVLSNNKGVNRLGGGLSAPALTDKDREDIKTVAAIKADYVAVSFPRSGADIDQARALLRQTGWDARIIAKIERAEAIDALEEILDASDGIMVARGDLAVEMGDAAVPGLQKRMIKMARAKRKLIITATQMMESMIDSPMPTRAEVSDVANAVLDGTDGVMLSAESAVGKYPVETISAMNRVCIEAEKVAEFVPEKDFEGKDFSSVEQSIALAAVFIAAHYPLRAIAALTESGTTALWMSRFNL
ncbi:MAG: pyruvate kinase, partial [Betaproteobacteria bacterium]|nr:pyruvate kinase [Betaproteobacteria bacterium]